jgi:hypothetical protein
MKNKTVRFGRAIVLSILLITCIISLVGVEDGQESTWNDVHVWSGFLMLVGAAVHLGTNWDWVKAVLSQPVRELKLRIRRLCRTNLWLFISGWLCTIAGLAWLVPGNSLEIVGRWTKLHRLTGIIMILILVIHLIQHWNWFLKTARWIRESQLPKAADRLGEAKV